MNLITEPKIYIVARPMLREINVDRFLEDEGFPDWETESPCAAQTAVELAARTCYMSFKKGRPHDEHLKHLLEVGHGSCIEHAVWGIIFTGISRSLTHELVRHRAGWAYSQLSQRYVDESVADFIVPKDLQDAVDCHHYMQAISYPAGSPAMTEAQADVRWPNVSSIAEKDINDYYDLCEIGGKWLDTVKTCNQTYKAISDYLFKKLDICPRCNGKGSILFPGHNEPYPCGDCKIRGTHPNKTEVRKAARQAARSVLPNATETKIYVTANARALRHFLEQRGSRHAEPEIRQLALLLLPLMQQEAPTLFGDYEVKEFRPGEREITTQWRKV